MPSEKTHAGKGGQEMGLITGERMDSGPHRASLGTRRLLAR